VGDETLYAVRRLLVSESEPRRLVIQHELRDRLSAELAPQLLVESVRPTAHTYLCWR
jgi:hypothetical protein